MIIPSNYVSADSQTTLSEPLGRLPLVLLDKIATYLPVSAFVHLSTTNRTWKALSHGMRLALIQQNFPIASNQLHSSYPGAIKISRLCALIYKGLQTTGCYPLQAIIAQPNLKAISLAVLDPTGSRIVTASYDGTAHVCAKQTDGGWVLTDILTGHKDSVMGVAFDPTGSHIVTASYDRTACVYAKQTDGRWALTDILTGHQGAVRGVAFDPTGSRIVTASYDDTACVYAKQTNGGWVLTDMLTGHEGSVFSAVFDPTGSHIVTASYDRTACVYAKQTDGRWALTDILTSCQSVYSAVFDPTGSRIVTASGDGIARVYAKRTDGCWVLTDMLTGHQSAVFSAVFDPTGSRIVTASQDGTARVYAKQTDGHWVFTDTLTGHKGFVYTAAFDSKGSCIVTASTDGKARIWGRNLRKIIRRAIGTIAIQDARIHTTYQAIPKDLVRYMAAFLTPSEQSHHRLVNRISARAYGYRFALFRLPPASLCPFNALTQNPAIRIKDFLQPREQQALSWVNRRLAGYLGHQTLLDRMDQRRRVFCIKIETEIELAVIIAFTLHLFSRMMAGQR